MCCGDVINENGFRICTGCGRTLSRHLETSLRAYNQGAHYFPVGYSRKSRFEKKVLGALRCISAHKVNVQLMDYLRTREIDTPKKLLSEIAKYPTKGGRRPYIYVMYYWKALGFKQPVVLEKDMDLLKREFDQIFFAWERLGFTNPKFPYSYTFKKLVTGQTKYSQGMRDLVPFVRTLRCQKRRKRYDRLFEICREFDFKKIVYKQRQMETIHEEKIDEMEIDAETVYPETIVYAHEVTKNPNIISPYDVKRVYKTQEEVQRAFTEGTFDVSKTMHIGPDGKFYFLQWQKEQKDKKEEESRKKEFQEQQRKLDELLKAQSCL